MTFQITIDPHTKFTHAPKDQTIGVCGILPHWAVSGSGETMKDSLINNYQFYMGAFTGGTIDDTGIYSYPEDPDLYPMLKIDRLDGEDLKEVCYIYEYAMVACKNIDTGDLWVTRMD